MQNLPVPFTNSLPATFAESRTLRRAYHDARPSNRRRISIPSATTLDGNQRTKGKTTVINSKAPKLRAKPGEFVELKGELLKKYGDRLWEVMYCFRVKGDHNWRYCLAVRKSVLQDDGKDEIGKVLDALGCGKTTPRVVSGQFLDDMAAHTFFADIPMHGDSIILSNQQMVSREVVLRSSGAVNSSAVVAR